MPSLDGVFDPFLVLEALAYLDGVFGPFLTEVFFSALLIVLSPFTERLPRLALPVNEILIEGFLASTTVPCSTAKG